jgi:mono/diheme cytochrome c family protein
VKLERGGERSRLALAKPRLAAVGLGLVGLLAQGCAQPGVEEEVVKFPAWLRTEEPSAEASAAALEAQRVTALERGKAVYRRACATCHGLRGDGKGRSAAQLEFAPWDFTSGLYARGAPEGDSLEYDIYYTISVGVPENSMPGWQELLSQEDRWSLVEYLKSLGNL